MNNVFNHTPYIICIICIIHFICIISIICIQLYYLYHLYHLHYLYLNWQTVLDFLDIWNKYELFTDLLEEDTKRPFFPSLETDPYICIHHLSNVPRHHHVLYLWFHTDGHFVAWENWQRFFPFSWALISSDELNRQNLCSTFPQSDCVMHQQYRTGSQLGQRVLGTLRGGWAWPAAWKIFKYLIRTTRFYFWEGRRRRRRRKKGATTSTCLPNDFTISPQVIDLKKGVLPIIRS